MSETNPPPRRPRVPKPAPPRSAAPEAPREAPREDARIAKIMARAGLCSRRDAETWIAAGRVAVNGATIESPALNVGPADRITVDGMPLPQREPTRLFLFHKPRGLVTTAKDPEGRQTIFDVLPADLPRIVTVGRLDINTEGLMLLTNDGGLARVLELPATGWLRRYRVRANGEVLQPALDALAAGITIDGVDYAGIEAKLDRVQGANAWLTMGLREGKNREIKRVLEHLGLGVNRLIRISFGPFQLGELAEGAVEEVRSRVLRDQLGEALALEAGVDFSERLARPQRSEVRESASLRDRASARPTPDRSGNRPLSRRLPVAEPLDPPRLDRPKAGARAHVSVLREARHDADAEGRRRTKRGSTEDRKGRAVAVERVSSVARKESSGSRNGRRFAAEKESPREERGGRPARAGSASQRPHFEAPRGERGRTSERGEGRSAEGRSAEGRGEARAPRRDSAPGQGRGGAEGRSFSKIHGPRLSAPAREDGPPREGGRSDARGPARPFRANTAAAPGDGRSEERRFAKRHSERNAAPERSAGRPAAERRPGARGEGPERAGERPGTGFKGRSAGPGGKGRAPGPSRSFGAKERPTGGLQGRPGDGFSAGKPGAGKPDGSAGSGRPRPSGGGGRGKPRG